MNKTRNPLQRRGKRNVFCPLYQGCLDHAVKHSWLFWACDRCGHKLNEGARPELKIMAADSIESYDLRLGV